MNKHYKGLGHIAVMTNDMAASIAFYEKIGGELQQQAAITTPDGDKLLALVGYGGFTLELIQPPVAAEYVEGAVPHFAVYVDDLDAAVAELEKLGVDTFMGPKKVLPDLFGGLQNRFFTGPSGEEIELLQML